MKFFMQESERDPQADRTVFRPTSLMNVKDELDAAEAERILSQKAPPWNEQLLLFVIIIVLLATIAFMVLVPPKGAKLDDTVQPQPPAKSWEAAREWDRGGSSAPGGN